MAKAGDTPTPTPTQLEQLIVGGPHVFFNAMDIARSATKNSMQIVKLVKILRESNMNETGFRIGIGKDQMIIIRRSRAHYFAPPENRESSTAVKAISASERVIPVFLILTGQIHMSQWYQVPELDPETAIHISPSGYSNDSISLEWLKHFEQHSAKNVLSAKRLLILDGHDFTQYGDDHQIILLGLPPHRSHLLQPLDVVVFQPLKHYPAKALDIMVSDGLTNITKLEFLSCIQGVRKQDFQEANNPLCF